MINEKQLNDFVERLKNAAGQNLESMVLYGSAASGEFHPQFSDINLLCTLRDLSAKVLDALAPPIRGWTSNGVSAPLLFASGDLRQAATVFPMEMLDIQRQHRMLYGADVFTTLQVPMDRHRAQLEHELRTKQLFLRQHYLLAGTDSPRVRHLMLDSVSNFYCSLAPRFCCNGSDDSGKEGGGCREVRSAGRI